MIPRPLTDHLTLIIPVHNEELNICDLGSRVRQLERDLLKREFYLHTIFLDNASSDDSWSLIKLEMLQLRQATAIRFTRNYGFQDSITHGLSLVSEGCAVILQSDLQDPPELIITLAELWRDGAKTVGAQPVKRSGNYLMNFVRHLFYSILSLSAGAGVRKGVQDFYLLDAQVCKELVVAKPQRQLLRTYISENFGFQSLVPYERSPRNAGKPSLKIVDYYDIALDAFLLSGRRGIRFLTLGSFTVASLSLCAAFALIFCYTIGWRPPIVGWLSLTVLFTTFSSLILSTMGLSLEFLQRLLRAKIGPAPNLESDRLTHGGISALIEDVSFNEPEVRDPGWQDPLH